MFAVITVANLNEYLLKKFSRESNPIPIILNKTKNKQLFRISCWSEINSVSRYFINISIECPAEKLIVYTNRPSRYH